MFKWLKSDPVKKAKKEYEEKAQEALEAQRNGNIALFAKLSQELEKLGEELDLLTKKSAK